MWAVIWNCYCAFYFLWSTTGFLCPLGSQTAVCFVVAISVAMFVHPGPHVWDAQQIEYTILIHCNKIPSLLWLG